MGISFLFSIAFHFSAVCKASSDSHFAFLHFFFLGKVLFPVSCTVSQTSIHSSSLKCQCGPQPNPTGILIGSGDYNGQRDFRDVRTLRKGHVRRWPSTSQGEMSQNKPALLTPCSWTSNLQNCERINFCCLSHSINGTLLQQTVAQVVKNLPAMQETQAQSLGQEVALEKGMTTHSSILAYRIPWMEEPGGLQSMGYKESNKTE